MTAWEAEADLVDRNSLRLPCRARWLAAARDERDVLDALDRARRDRLAVWVLGEGSNVVLPPRLDGVVLHMAASGIDVLDDRQGRVRVRVEAGTHWDAVVHWAAAQGVWGIENLAAIPGAAGAAPVQNIGAYGQELATICRRVRVVERETGRISELDAHACGFAYRDSCFRRDPDAWVIVAVELELRRRGRPQLAYPGVEEVLAELGLTGETPAEVVRAISMLRGRKLPDPGRHPNAGSFFKNPVVPSDRFLALREHHPELPGHAQKDGVKLSAAWLIERCGWRGKRRGGVGIAPEHALVLVHHGGADAATLLAFAADIAASVRERFGVELEPEPVMPGQPRPQAEG